MIKTILSKEQRGYEWLDVYEPNNDDFAFIKEKFDLNEASIKDSKEPEHLPKIEEFDNYTFIILRALSDSYNNASDSIGEITDRVTIFYGSDFVITLHRAQVSSLTKLQEIAATSPKAKDAKHLALAITTGALLSFTQTLNELSEKIDTYEEVIFLKRHQRETILKKLYFIKRQVDVARKVVLLYREIIEHFNIQGKKNVYVRDLKDLHVRTSTLYENLSENITQLLNIYFNISSNHTNEIMRILTIFSVFFMPITFVAGIYGMNFEYMPELLLPYGYPIAIGLMVLISLSIFIWFKRKGWL